MTREQLIAVIGKPIHDMRYNAAQYSTIEIAEAVRVAIEAAGLCIVPVAATERQIRSAFSCGDGDPHYVYGAMIAAGKL